MMMFNSQPQRPSFLTTLIGLGLLVLFFMGIFYVVRGVYTAYVLVVPILMVVLLFVNKKVLLDYFAGLVAKYRVDLMSGILSTATAVIFAPFVLAFLLLKAVLINKFGQMTGNMERPKNQDDFIQYEEIQVDDLKSTPRTSKPQLKNPIVEETDYEELF